VTGAVTEQAPGAAILPVEHRPGFLAPTQATELLRTLLDGVPWQQEWLQLYGRRIAVPRLLAWCGEPGLNYRYSGTDHVCRGWLPELLGIRRRLAVELGVGSNLVLINRYRDGRDHMGWHADDERGLARRVASLSLGATRRFLIRLPGEPRSRSVDLEHGSVLVLDGSLRHALPPTRRPVEERLNLTFRRIQPGSS
jgi:alkylated DNA repair dioxygenase AlkB